MTKPIAITIENDNLTAMPNLTDDRMIIWSSASLATFVYGAGVPMIPALCLFPQHPASLNMSLEGLTQRLRDAT